METITIPTCDQYTIQADLFAQAVQQDTEVPWPLERSLENMRVIEALFQAAEERRWVDI
jgi:predicted dehydrogenase